MLVALDADFLLLLLDPDAKPPHDPTTQRPLDRAKDRIEYLIANLDNAKSLGDKKAGSTAPWAKVKFDRQIVAIALVNGVQTIYSSDEDIAKYATARGIAVTKLWELPLPPAEQPSLPNMQPEGSVGRSDATPEPGLSEAAGGENDADGE